MIKAVIFDIGDVLVNFGWREFLEKNFDDPDLREELAREVFEHETWGYCDAHDLSLEEEISAFASHAPHLEKEIRYILTHMSERKRIQSLFPVQLFPYRLRADEG